MEIIGKLFPFCFKLCKSHDSTSPNLAQLQQIIIARNEINRIGFYCQFQ